MYRLHPFREKVAKVNGGIFIIGILHKQCHSNNAFLSNDISQKLAVRFLSNIDRRLGNREIRYTQ